MVFQYFSLEELLKELLNDGNVTQNGRSLCVYLVYNVSLYD